LYEINISQLDLAINFNILNNFNICKLSVITGIFRVFYLDLSGDSPMANFIEQMMRFVKTGLLFALIFLSILSSAKGSQKTIRVGVYQNKPKVFVDNSGRARGFFIDILEYIAKKESWNLVYISGTWEQCLIRLKSNQIDLLVDVADSLARIEIFDFSKVSVFSNWAAIYVPKQSTINSVLDLRQKTIAAMRGDVSYEEFKQKLKRLDLPCRFKEVDCFADIFKKIDGGAVDAGLISRLFGLSHEQNYDARRTGIVCCPKNLYFAIPKNGDKSIINIIDQRLNYLKADENSIYYESLMKWIEGVRPQKLPNWLGLVLTLTAALLVLFMAGSVVLRMRVNAKTSELKKANAELETARQHMLSQMNSLKTINEIASRLYRSLDYNAVAQQAVDAMANFSQSPLVAFFEKQIN